MLSYLQKFFINDILIEETSIGGNIIFYDFKAQQNEHWPPFISELPWKSFGRKNIGEKYNLCQYYYFKTFPKPLNFPSSVGPQFLSVNQYQQTQKKLYYSKTDSNFGKEPSV